MKQLLATIYVILQCHSIFSIGSDI